MYKLYQMFNIFTKKFFNKRATNFYNTKNKPTKRLFNQNTNNSHKIKDQSIVTNKEQKTDTFKNIIDVYQISISIATIIGFFSGIKYAFEDIKYNKRTLSHNIFIISMYMATHGIGGLFVGLFSPILLLTSPYILYKYNEDKINVCKS